MNAIRSGMWLTAIAWMLAPVPVLAQTNDQLRSCQEYVSNTRGFEDLSRRDIEVQRDRTDSSGNASVLWQVSSRRASGSCVVNRRNAVVQYRRDRDFNSSGNHGNNNYGNNNYGNNSNVDYSYGNAVRPYRIDISGNSTRQLLSRPDKNRSDQVGRVNGGESVTIYRTYRDRDDTTWVLVQGSRGQEGWINSRRLEGGAVGSYGDDPDVNYDFGQEVRPYQTQISAGQGRELLDRPDRNRAKVVSTLQGGARVTVYKTYRDRDNVTWALVKGSNGDEGWINSRRLEGGAVGSYGNNPDVSYDLGQEVRPFETRLAAGPARELLNRPGKDRSKVVSRLNGGAQVTVYKTYRDADNTTWALVKSSNGDEGWINSRRLEGGDTSAYGNNPDVEYRYGDEIRPYRTQIQSGSDRELLSRPSKTNAQEIGRVKGDETVTVYRTYRDSDDTTWALVKTANGDEGWINSRRLR